MKSRALLTLTALLSTATLAGCALGGGSEGAADAPGNVGFGGAQDIGQFRNILETGGIPGPGTLDAAGFFSEHYVSLPPADCGQALCLQSMLSVGESWVDGSYQSTLAIALSTPIDPSTIEPRPLDLVVVVDTSGSMSEGDRIGYVKNGLDLLIDALGPEDRMALVTYSSDVNLFQSFPVNDETFDVEAWRADMHETVAGLRAAGATNIYAGLDRGFQLAGLAREESPERAQRVVLLSDGLATTGITDDASIITMAEEYIESGIGLTTVGVGLEFNIELMRGLAERGAGNFYFLEDPEAVEEVFTEELDYFVEPLALSVTIEVRAAGGHGLGEVVGTRLWRTEGDVGSMHLPAVFVASRTSAEPGESGGRRGGGGTLFVPLRAGETAFAGPVAEVRLRYRPADGDDFIDQSIEVLNPADPSVTPEEAYYSHEAMAKQYAMYNLYLGLYEASTLATYDDTCALAQLRDLDERAARWNLELQDEDIEADRELIGLFMDNLRERGVQDLPEGQSCYGYGEPYPVDSVVDDHHGPLGCSAAGGSAGAGTGLGMLLLWAGAVVLAGRRRVH